MSNSNDLTFVLDKEASAFADSGYVSLMIPTKNDGEDIKIVRIRMSAGDSMRMCSRLASASVQSLQHII